MMTLYRYRSKLVSYKSLALFFWKEQIGPDLKLPERPDPGSKINPGEGRDISRCHLKKTYEKKKRKEGGKCKRKRKIGESTRKWEVKG